MPGEKVQFRAAPDELDIIDQHAQRLANATGQTITRSEAARDIVRRFGGAIADSDPWHGAWTGAYREGRRAGFLEWWAQMRAAKPE